MHTAGSTNRRKQGLTLLAHMKLATADAQRREPDHKAVFILPPTATVWRVHWEQGGRGQK